MSNEWAHVAARKGVPTEMINLIHDGHVLTDTSGRVQAGSAGAYLRYAGTAQLVQDRGIFVPARPKVGTTTIVAPPQTTLQKRGHLAWRRMPRGGTLVASVMGQGVIRTPVLAAASA